MQDIKKKDGRKRDWDNGKRNIKKKDENKNDAVKKASNEKIKDMDDKKVSTYNKKKVSNEKDNHRQQEDRQTSTACQGSTKHKTINPKTSNNNVGKD